MVSQPQHASITGGSLLGDSVTANGNHEGNRSDGFDTSSMSLRVRVEP